MRRLGLTVSAVPVWTGCRQAPSASRYQDRVLYGADMGREGQMCQGWWRLLETGDEFMPGRIWWRQYGLEPPVPVLKQFTARTPRGF